MDDSLVGKPIVVEGKGCICEDCGAFKSIPEYYAVSVNTTRYDARHEGALLKYNGTVDILQDDNTTIKTVSLSDFTKEHSKLQPGEE